MSFVKALNIKLSIWLFISRKSFKTVQKKLFHGWLPKALHPTQTLPSEPQGLNVWGHG